MNYSILKRSAVIPLLENCKGESHYITPTKAKIQGIMQFCDKIEIEYFKEDVFQAFDVFSQQR